MKYLSLFVIIAGVALSGKAQDKASLAIHEGFVYSVDDNGEQPADFGKVMYLNGDSSVVKGTQLDFDGTFKIGIKPGSYIMKVVVPGMTEHFQDVTLISGTNEALKIEVKAPVVEFGTIEVVHYTSTTSDQNVTEDVKEDVGVKSAKTAAQIAGEGNKDTGDALNKMSGISTSNSVIYVRGMGDRYNAAYLNGLPVPSPDPELKVIPMDIFPTSIIDVLEVNKFMGPNFYGDFSGGAINIKTRKVYRDPTFNVSIGTSTNTIATFQDFLTYKGGKLDYFGYDDGTRSIPVGVIQASQESADEVYQNGIYNSSKANIGTGFSNNLNAYYTKAQPGSSFKFDGGNYWSFNKEKGRDRGIGFVTMLSQSSGFSRNDGYSRFINAQNKLDYDFEVKSQSFNASTTGLASVMWDIKKGHNVALNYLFINDTEDNVSETWGYHRDFSDDAEGEGVYARRSTYTQNQIHNMQLVGINKFLEDKLLVNWGGSYSITRSLVPDRRQIAAMYDDKDDTEHYRMLALDANHTHRFFSDLRENETAAHIDGNYTFFEHKDSSDAVTSSLKLIVGGDFKSKGRTFNFRQFNYVAKPLADQIGRNYDIYNPDQYLTDEAVDQGLLRVEESANPGNGYTAFQDIIGTNIGAQYVLSKKFELIPNVRVEKGFQSVKSRKQTQADVIIINVIDDINLMPSLAGKYSITENQLLRFGGSRTITRPKFFELAPFEYIAQIAGKTQIGNPELQNGVNYNADVRYEYYFPGSADMITVGVFGKRLITPIEQIMRPSAGGQLISFDNTDLGHVAGTEVEFAKNLGFLSSNEKSVLRDFAIAGNVAYIYSQININDTTGFTTSTRRPLQGASPFMGNVSLKWEKKIRREAKTENPEAKASMVKLMTAVSYSYSGRSLFAVGTQGVGDQYQFASHNLNVVVGLTYPKLSIGLTGRNLTNNLFRIMQEDKVNLGEWQEVNAYRIGSSLSFTLTYKFLRDK